MKRGKYRCGGNEKILSANILQSNKCVDIDIGWFKSITYKNGKPNTIATVMLAEIVDWYTAIEEVDKNSGQVVIYKKFKEDMPQLSYKVLSEKYGYSKLQVKEAIKQLENLGIIKRVFKNVHIEASTLNNVLYIDLDVQKLGELSKCKIEAVRGEFSIYSYNDIGVSFECGGGSLNNGGVEFYSDTNTKTNINNNNNSCSIYNNLSINQSNNHKDIDTMDKYNKTKELIKKNIQYNNPAYDKISTNTNLSKQNTRSIVDEIVEIMTEMVVLNTKPVTINKTPIPAELIKDRFLNLDFNDIYCLIIKLSENENKIHNTRAYLIASLYNVKTTKNNTKAINYNYNYFIDFGQKNM